MNPLDYSESFESWHGWRINSKPVHATGATGPLEAVLRNGGLYPVFQPIVNLDDASIHAHEALIRGPQGTPLHVPDAMLVAAAKEGLSSEFEYACLLVAMRNWGGLKSPGRLFVNMSANVLTRLFDVEGLESLLDAITRADVRPRSLVIELTEHERVSDMDHLAHVVSLLRSTGISIALDDFGDGRSSLRLWSQIKPEVVKIDKYFTKDIYKHSEKLKTIQALQQIASNFETQLVAEGVETAEDLRVLRDLGIAYGQGYFLGHPDRQPIHYLNVQSQRVMGERQITVFPTQSRARVGGQLRNLSLVMAPSANTATTNEGLATIFLADSTLHAVAFLEGDRPIGIINRAAFMNEYSKLYYREVWGKKSCSVHVNWQPRLIERDHSVDELLGILTSQDQRYLADGFIVTQGGRYIGLGTGDQLVRSVTETRIEAARHANPLTLLPGNIPITQHMQRLLTKQVRFVACYADLNHFKPFNDYFGYWKGDEMICLLSRIAMHRCDAQRDFLGHVGGDDFIMLFQSADWRQRCEGIVAEFNDRAPALFDVESRKAGGIEAEDRHGIKRFFPITTLTVGAIVIDPSRYEKAEDVANAAALAKHDAKQAGVGVFQRVN